jgi:hypothetical protein
MLYHNKTDGITNEHTAAVNARHNDLRFNTPALKLLHSSREILIAYKTKHTTQTDRRKTRGTSGRKTNLLAEASSCQYRMRDFQLHRQILPVRQWYLNKSFKQKAEPSRHWTYDKLKAGSQQQHRRRFWSPAYVAVCATQHRRLALQENNFRGTCATGLDDTR